MQANALPITHGWYWVRDGFRLFLRQPFALFTWAMTLSLLICLVSMLLVVIGPLSLGVLILLGVLMPILMLMTLSACKHIAANETLLPAMWLQPLQQPPLVKKLLILGLLYEGFFLLAGLCAFLPFARELTEGLRVASTTQNLMPFVQAMSPPLLLFSIFYALIAAFFWHAPVLMAWHQIPLKQALFFSGIACWRNKGAILLYALTWAALFFCIDLGAHLLMTMGLSPTLVNILQIPINIAACSILYSSLYPVYTSIFNINHSRLELNH